MTERGHDWRPAEVPVDSAEMFPPSTRGAECSRCGFQVFYNGKRSLESAVHRVPVTCDEAVAAMVMSS